jgi:hypothetical protein
MMRPLARFGFGIRILAWSLAAACLIWPGCSRPNPAAAPSATGSASGGAASRTEGAANPEFRGATHDLSEDESAGGHTLRRHVGRSDEELRERLAQEDIAASSTYTDRAAAEFAVGNALQQGQYRIEQWLARSGSHPNLVLDYRADQPIGRTLHRRESASQPCANAKVVLRWLSSSEYYVLTSYPECR